MIDARSSSSSSLPRRVRSRRPWTSLVLAAWVVGSVMITAAAAPSTTVPPNIHAVIVSSSRYWFNYRHAMNALGIYQILQSNGIPDSQIVLMIADEYATNPRNPFKNGMYVNGAAATATTATKRDTWYSERTQLDYRGSDVTVQHFFDALLGVGPKSLQNTNEESRLLIFVTGHGGDQFFKFQDEEELTAQDIANLMEELAKRRKFSKAVFIADTCQAFTLFDKITTPNVYALGTSLRGENAYAHHSDNDLGLSVIERWTHAFLQNYHRRPEHPQTTTLHDLMVQPFEGDMAVSSLGAHVGVLGDLRELPLHEFFGHSTTSPTGSQRRKRKGTSPLTDKTAARVMPFQPSTSSTVRPKKKKKNEIASTESVNTRPTLTDASRPSSQSSSTTTRATLDPTEYSFGLLVGGLLVLVVFASQFGKSHEDDDGLENTR